MRSKDFLKTVIDRTSDLKNWVDLLKEMVNNKRTQETFCFREQSLRRVWAGDGQAVHGLVGQRIKLWLRCGFHLSGKPTYQGLTATPKGGVYTSHMKPNPGEIVILTAIPRGMLDDLPEDDQRAIKEIVGRPVLLSEYDDVGRAEIEFTDRSGQLHSLFVAPEFIARSGIDSKLELRTRVELEIKRAFLGVGDRKSVV